MSTNPRGPVHLWSLGFLLAFLAFLIVLGGRSVFNYPSPAAAPAETDSLSPVLIGEMDGLTGWPEILDVSDRLLPTVRDETPGLAPEELDWRDGPGLGGYLAPFYPPPR